MGGAHHAATRQAADYPKWMGNAPAQEYLNLYQQLAAPGGQIAPYNPAMNQQLAAFTPTQEQAMGGILGQVPGAQGLADVGGGQLGATLGGAYLAGPGMNPYLDPTYAAAARGMVNQYQTATAPSLMAEAQRAGAYGSTAFDQAQALNQYGLGQNLSDLAAQIYGGAYEAERGRQMQGLGALPSTLAAQFAPQQQALGIGTLQQQQAQQGLDIGTANALRQQQYGYTVLDALGGALGTAAGPGYTSSTVVPIRSGMMGFK